MASHLSNTQEVASSILAGAKYLFSLCACTSGKIALFVVSPTLSVL